MQNQVSETLNRLSESATLAMSRKSRELKAKGIDVISLSLGEPDFYTPDFIKQAAKEGIDGNFSLYTPVNGYEDLRISIAAKFKRDNNIEYSPEQIVVSTGAKQTIMNLVLSLINEGDEVILPAPYWVSYVEMVKLVNGTPIIIPSSVDTNYKITATELENSITEKSRLMIFSSPCNPSGSVYSESELRAFAGVIKKYPNLIVISDEIYEHINFTANHFSLASIKEIYDQVVTVNGVSKAFAMTGWRIGYMGGPQWIAAACTKLQGQFTSGASGISQRAAKAAVEANPEVIKEMRKAFLKRRNLVIGLLDKIPGLKQNKPEGAFYVFPDVSAYFGKTDGNTLINNADDLAEYLLENAHVATVSGEAFGTPECIRISYATSENLLTEAIVRIEKALARLKA